MQIFKKNTKFQENIKNKLIKIIEIVIAAILIKIIKIRKIKIKKSLKINYKRAGEYKTIMGNCVSCHTLHGGRPFVGGYSLKTIFGVVNTPNITSNKNFGIGSLKLKNFINILRNGVNKKGKFLFPALPYLNYNNIKKKDIKDIFLFLKKTKNENVINKSNFIKFPIKYKNTMLGWRILFFKKNYFKKKKYKTNISRGKYISKSLAHCDMCHTKMNKIGKRNNYFRYRGQSIVEGWWSTEITNSVRGVKKKNIKDLYNILKNGVSKEKCINSVMSEVINNSLQYMNKIDLISIARYIKNNINDRKIIEFNKKNKNKSKKYEESKIFYKKKCSECHGIISLGNYPVYPKIIKKKKDKNELKNLKNILKKNNVTNTIKNRYPAIMQNFVKIKNKILKLNIGVNKKLTIV